MKSLTLQHFQRLRFVERPTEMRVRISPGVLEGTKVTNKLGIEWL
jgi:hypothetical protein